MRTMFSLLESPEVLEQEISSSSVLSDAFESISLVISGVSNLFCKKGMTRLLKKATATQTKVEKLKKQIIYATQGLDGGAVLAKIKEIPSNLFRSIGTEFILQTARKIAKQYAIEKYSLFLQIIFGHFDFDPRFLKAFFIIERDASEITFLVDYIAKWSMDDPISHRFLVNQSAFYFLERAIQSDSSSEFTDFFELLNSLVKFLNPDTLQENLQNLLTIFLGYSLSKPNEIELLNKSLNIFESKGLYFDQILLTKLLKALNRNSNNEETLKFILNKANQNNIDMDLNIYNLLMEFYVNNDYEKTKNTFDEIKQKNFIPNSQTFSLLIKGLKSTQDRPVERGLELLEEYTNQNEQDILLYNSLLDVMIAHQRFDKVDFIFQQALKVPLKPDEMTFNTIIKGSCNQKNLQMARKYLNLMTQYEFKPNRITFNTLMDCAVKNGQMSEALSLFEEMSQQIEADNYTYAILLNGLKLNDSQIGLVKGCLKSFRIVLDENIIKFDLVTFNALFDVCSKYGLVDEMQYFMQVMRERGIKDNNYTCTTLINTFTQANRYQEALEIFKRMHQSGMLIRESLYGIILECLMKNGQSEMVLQLFDSLQDKYFNMNSIVFTTIVKGFIKQQCYDEALAFFEKIRHLKELPGMIITFNCALDIYSNKLDTNAAIKLFEEIDQGFGADLISYSTIIKATCKGNLKNIALEYVKRMVKANIHKDVSVVNLFLESCANRDDFKLAVECYKFIMAQGITPNEVTFGIMVKVFGFSYELDKAFDLLDLMEVFHIHPSIIIFTNLIHISFYCKQPRKAELAYNLFKKQGLDGDALLYSKIIDGLIRFKQFNKVPKYIEYCLQEQCTLQEKTLRNIEKNFQSPEFIEKIKQIESFASLKKKPHKHVNKMVNNFNIENPKKYKKEITSQRQHVVGQDKNEGGKERNGFHKKNNAGPIKLHNFRANRNQQIIYNIISFKENK